MNFTLARAGAALSMLGFVALAGCGGNSSTPPAVRSRVIALWCTTSVAAGGTYQQMDRLARPAVNELFATVANDRHKTNDLDNPADDKNQLANDIQSFMNGTAGRNQKITDTVKSVLVPDVVKADLGSTDNASYLGYETGGATGGKFGGRALTDDVIDISLGIVFGDTIPTLFPSLKNLPGDTEVPGLTSDNVDASGKHFTSTFPYLGAPR